MKTQYLKQLIAATGLTLLISVSYAQVTPEQVVQDFVTAFNQQDVNGMLRLSSNNVTWMSVAGATTSVEAEGSAALKAAMEDYFLSHPNSYSKIRQINSSGPWVTTLEHAGREVDGQFKGKCAYAMYELNNELIESVWYFAAHDCDPFE